MTSSYCDTHHLLSGAELPLLQVVRESYPLAVLDDVYVICAQHLLKTSTILFHNLFELGLDSGHFSVIGKCYSTDPAVYYELKNIRGLDVCCSSQHFYPDQSFDSQYAENVKRFVEQRVERILNSNCRKLIVVDDGGELIQSIHYLIKNCILPSEMEIIGVEQTSSGYKKLQVLDISFPVVNVARSYLKLNLESNIIADSIMKNLELAFNEIRINPDRALILGLGSIGKKVKTRLSLLCPVDYFDPEVNNPSIHCFENIDFGQYNLILGCSGHEAISSSDLCRLKKDTVLANCSSSDREFCGVTFRNQLKQTIKCHEHIYAHDVHLLNCGFPVNFSSHYTYVDDARYQLTRALLLAGILQGHTQVDLRGHFIDLDLTLQQVLGSHFCSIYPYHGFTSY